MTHSKSKLTTKDIKNFREFLELRGFKCRDEKGDWQSLQVQNVTDRGWKAFCHNAKGVVTSPVEFDALIQVFRAPVDPAPADEVIDRPASHDSDLLDDFAIAALQGICSHPDTWGLDSKGIVQKSYELALFAMAERAKHQPK